MVSLAQTDWRKELGIPEEPTEEEMLRGLQTLTEWYEREAQQRHRESEEIRGRYLRLRPAQRKCREGEFQAAWKALDAIPDGLPGLSLREEYHQRCYVLAFGLHPYATEEEVVVARRARIYRHFAVKYGLPETASPEEVMDEIRKRHQAAIETLEPARKAAAIARGLPESASWDQIFATVHLFGGELGLLENGLPDGCYTEQGSLRRAEFYLHEWRELRWPTRSFPPPAVP
jgi:hypothetical protein